MKKYTADCKIRSNTFPLVFNVLKSNPVKRQGVAEVTGSPDCSRSPGSQWHITGLDDCDNTFQLYSFVSMRILMCLKSFHFHINEPLPSYLVIQEFGINAILLYSYGGYFITLSNDNDIMWQIYLLASSQAQLGTRLRKDDREVGKLAKKKCNLVLLESWWYFKTIWLQSLCLKPYVNIKLILKSCVDEDMLYYSSSHLNILFPGWLSSLPMPSWISLRVLRMFFPSFPTQVRFLRPTLLYNLYTFVKHHWVEYLIGYTAYS